MMKIMKWLAALWVAIAFLSFGMSAQAESTHVVKTGETLFGVAKVYGKDWKQLCKVNNLKNCNLIYPGQRLVISGDGKAKGVQPKAPTKTPEDVFYWRHVGGAPLFGCGAKATATLNEEAWQKLGLSDEEKAELRQKVAQKPTFSQKIMTGKRFVSVAFCEKGKIAFKQNVVGAWSPSENVVADTYVLESGRKLLQVTKCGNWAVDKEFVPPPPPVTQPEPKQEMILPVHAKEGDTIPCELQAGVGAYKNKIYKGTWQYAEGICYIFKDGEWQHGPGFYAMGGKGESRLSSYHGNERGIGLQYGVQRNFVTDDGDLATFELKGRLLSDRSKGTNPDSGYWMKQEGLKAGLYGSYYERHGDDLYGVIGEYWRGISQSIKSSWSGDRPQDRGSLAFYGVYEHQLSDDDAWRLRWIGGIQHTNWDHQNWGRFAAEFRYNEWLMFGPQLSLALGVSDANAAFHAHDLTTLGAFVRVELGKQARNADANNREAQVEFIPAHSSPSSVSGEPAGEATKPTQ